jgi:RsiW-degrading membrane proteinase PrsW (M82 family)
MDMYRWLVILAATLIPTVVYTIYIRNIEHYLREEWRWILVSYLWGALAALPFIFILAFLFSGQYLREHEYYKIESSTFTIILICIILPLTMELMKIIGIYIVRDRGDEVEDGLIHGATIGLGFAAFANIFYLYQGFDWDPKALVVLIIPTISTALLHASSSAVTGYSAARWIVKEEKLRLVVFFLAGVWIHALFNAFSLSMYISQENLGFTYYIIGLLVILLVSNLVFRTIRARMHKLIKILDEETEMERRKSLPKQQN